MSLDALMAVELLRPALLIGVPVGFVNVVESKELIIEGGRAPYIVARGRKWAAATSPPPSATPPALPDPAITWRNTSSRTEKKLRLGYTTGFLRRRGGKGRGLTCC